ncbi:MAG: hypothetical protein RMH74_04655, partial [Candidatus Caldarchaeum sp.]|nr:hypothetical protein [Candidatus Caldarchaeum sp.]
MGLTALSDILQHHTTPEARTAASYMVRGPGALLFWTVFLAVGIAASTAAAYLYMSSANYIYGLTASLTSLAGLAVYEVLWMKAGQAA